MLKLRLVLKMRARPESRGGEYVGRIVRCGGGNYACQGERLYARYGRETF